MKMWDRGIKNLQKNLKLTFPVRNSYFTVLFYKIKIVLFDGYASKIQMAILFIIYLLYIYLYSSRLVAVIATDKKVLFLYYKQSSWFF